MFELKGVLSWVIMGLLAGAAGKVLVPGRDPGGIAVTILIGIAGALVGGMLSTALGFGGVNALDIRSLIISILGAMVLLVTLRILGIKSEERKDRS